VRTVLTIGTFDVPHLGHAYLLRQCEGLGDTVLVGVNSDEFVEQYKGARPAFAYRERMELISAMGYEVRYNDGPGRDLILRVRPAVLAIGMDWLEKDYTAQINMTVRELSQSGIVLAYVPTMAATELEKLSATRIKDRLR